MILDTKQGQKAMAQSDPQPYTNPTPTLHPGAVVGTPEANGKLRSRQRLVVPPKQTLGRALIDWMGKLTLSGGDLDGEKFTVWPWEASFLRGTFSQPGNAALSVGRGNGGKRIRSWTCYGCRRSWGAVSWNAARGHLLCGQFRPGAHNIRGCSGLRSRVGA